MISGAGNGSSKEEHEATKCLVVYHEIERTLKRQNTYRGLWPCLPNWNEWKILSISLLFLLPPPPLFSFDLTSARHWFEARMRRKLLRNSHVHHFGVDAICDWQLTARMSPSVWKSYDKNYKKNKNRNRCRWSPNNPNEKKSVLFFIFVSFCVRFFFVFFALDLICCHHFTTHSWPSHEKERSEEKKRTTTKPNVFLCTTNAAYIELL